MFGRLWIDFWPLQFNLALSLKLLFKSWFSNGVANSTTFLCYPTVHLSSLDCQIHWWRYYVLWFLGPSLYCVPKCLVVWQVYWYTGGIVVSFGWDDWWMTWMSSRSRLIHCAGCLVAQMNECQVHWILSGRISGSVMMLLCRDVQQLHSSATDRTSDVSLYDNSNDSNVCLLPGYRTIICWHPALARPSLMKALPCHEQTNTDRLKFVLVLEINLTRSLQICRSG